MDVASIIFDDGLSDFKLGIVKLLHNPDETTVVSIHKKLCNVSCDSKLTCEAVGS